MSEDTNKRFNAILKHFGFTRAEFSRRIGLDNNSTVTRIASGDVKPSFDILSRIAKTFPEINPGWLLTGEGEMLKQNNEPKQTQDGNVEYWRSLVDYLTKELEEKRRDYIELRDEVRELKTQLVMHNQEDKKKEANPEK